MHFMAGKNNFSLLILLQLVARCSNALSVDPVVGIERLHLQKQVYLMAVKQIHSWWIWNINQRQ